MAIKLSNNAVSRLAAELAQGDTQIILTPGDGSMFPTLSPGDFFQATLVKASGQYECVRATARDADTLTVLRAQENTQALHFASGDRIELRVTAGMFDLLQQSIDAKLDKAGGAVSGALAVSGAITQAGNPVWHAGNLTPGSYAALAGASFTGNVVSAPLPAPMAVNDSNGPLRVQNNGGTGDNNFAGMVFLATNQYGIKLGVRHDGYFGLGGWSRAAWSWYSDPSGNMVAAGNVSAYSDPRLKDDVERISGALALVEQLDGVRFTWNGKTALIGKPGARDVGVLADQVEAVLPEAVGRSVPDEENGGERWRVVDYTKLVPLLVEAVKELAGIVKRKGV
ncbi:hypothetical protein QkW1_44 [Ralstonia phage QkW1]